MAKKSLEKLLKQEKRPEKSIADTGKFRDNPFAKKYKDSLDKLMADAYGVDLAGEDVVDSTVYAWQAAQEVKSWKRERVGGLISWLKGRPDLTRGELYISILIGGTIGNILANL